MNGEIAMDVVNVNDVLDGLFPGYLSPERAAAWEAAKNRFALGSKVQGNVVAKFHFGVFVDINAGFPSLLLVVRMRGARQDPYMSMERYPAIGSAVEARVCGWTGGSHRQIGLTQLERDPSWESSEN